MLKIISEKYLLDLALLFIRDYDLSYNDLMLVKLSTILFVFIFYQLP